MAAANGSAATGPTAGTPPDAPDGQPLLCRVNGTWRVVGRDGALGEDGDLIAAMVLADLLVPPPAPQGRPRPARPGAADVERLRGAVAQLEHALSSRVVVERAIGALAERRGTSTRQAFEALRRESRASGRRVHELAALIVAGLDART